MTVGLVIVSHSALIAEGVVELAAQMAPSVAIVAAGGTDDGGIGTSFDRVQAAMADAESGDGVVVLCDLGSAVLTAETALDLADAPERIRIADAPVVEGAVAAAVAAEAGDDLEAVAAAAEGRPASPSPTEAPPEPGTHGEREASPERGSPGETARLEVALENEHGLHARPAAELVRTAARFDARVTVDGVDAKSLLQVLAMGIDRGQRVSFEASGPEASEAIAAIEALVRSGFGERA